MMNKYLVALSNGHREETVKAVDFNVSQNGDLLFFKRFHTNGTEIFLAYASGTWLSVALIEGN